MNGWLKDQRKVTYHDPKRDVRCQCIVKEKIEKDTTNI